MTDAEQMRHYQYLAERATRQLETLAPVIANEVERRFGHKIFKAKREQERENLRQYYTMLVSRENIWRQTYLSDRDLYIRLATMYGIAALVNRTSATNFPEIRS